MFISPRVYEALLDADVQVVDRGDKGDSLIDLLLLTGDHREPVRVQVKVSQRPIGPAQILVHTARHPEQQFLFIAAKFSDTSRDLIESAGWSWVAVPDDLPVTGALHLPGCEPIPLGAAGKTSSQKKPPEPSKGRRPWQRYAIIRHLLLRPTWTQADLVDVCDVTQPRVSQVLRQLEAKGLVARTIRHQEPSGETPRARWTVTKFDTMVDTWLNGYPGPGGTAPTYWFGLDPVAKQVQLVHKTFARTAGGDSPRTVHQDNAHIELLASGDAAADYIAPYRRSQLAVVYARRGADLATVGLTPAPREQATIKLVVPEDPSVWPHPKDDPATRLAPNAPVALADPLQVAWDLLDSGTPDADQAADAVLRALRNLRDEPR